MIKLEPFDKADFDRLISWIDSEELMVQFAGPIFKFPLTIDQLELYITNKNRFVFKVIKLDTTEVIGHSEIYYSKNKIAKLCRILLGKKKSRGQGFGKEIVKKLVEISFNKLGALSVELNVYNWNTSAIKCYEKVGFVIDPQKNKRTQFNNYTWTAVHMTLNKL